MEVWQEKDGEYYIEDSLKIHLLLNKQKIW